MTFQWPQNLWILLLVPLVAAAYCCIAIRRRRALRSSSELLRESLGLRPFGHVPSILFVLALTALIAASARPTAVMTLPAETQTVVLAIDVSGSMQADDVQPTRLGAAQAAAREFVRALPAGARIGVVTFTDTANAILKPTSNREAVLEAIGTLSPQQGTAIGSAILASLQSLFPESHFDPDGLEYGASVGAGAPSRAKPEIDTSSAIVLLTDGQNTDGPSPIEAAALAARLGVRIYTVGVGTSHGEIYRGVNWAMPVGIDEDSLKQIAKGTQAAYFYASSAPDLKKIYADLGTRLVLDKRKLEVTAVFSAFGAILLLASGGLSLLWYGRVA